MEHQSYQNTEHLLNTSWLLLSGNGVYPSCLPNTGSEKFTTQSTLCYSDLYVCR